MAAYKVKWEPDTKIDLKEIYWYYATQALVPAAGKRLVNKIRKEGNALKHGPHYAAVYDKKRGLRRIFVGSYHIYFIINEEKRIVNITQVVRGNRDLPNVLR
jgi:plasmid stabilization system protein ParE